MLKYQSAPTVTPKTSVDLVSNNDPDAYFFRKLELQNINLNEKQIEAVRNYKDPLLVTASPGSGKSLVIIAKVAYMIDVLNVPPESILVITYTRKAAEELRERLKNMNISGNIMARTIHSLCYQILLQNMTEHHKLLIHEKDRISIIKRVLKELGLSSQFQPEDALLQLSCIKNKLQRLEPDHQLYPVYKLYNSYLKENKLLDFDRILILTYNILVSNLRLLGLLQDRFQHILVDEMQDITMVQLRIIQMIAAPENRICCVGDPKQTIFGFSGADVNLILNFDKYFSNAKTINLDVNYRNSASVAGLANAIIRQSISLPYQHVSVIKHSGPPPVFIEPDDIEAEAKYVVDHIIRAVKTKKYSYKDFCILYRSFNSARTVYEHLILQDIPFVQPENQDIIYEHEAIKPLIDHMRLCLDPYNLNALSGILPTLYLNRINTLQFVNQMQRKNTGMSLLDMLQKLPDLQEFQYTKIRQRLDMIRQLKDMAPTDAIKAIRENGYDKFYKLNNSLSLQTQIILDLVHDVEDTASQYEFVEQFLCHINELTQKVNTLRQGDLPDDAVSFMSIHSSKGLQFKVVFLVGCIDGVLPHKNAVEPSLLCCPQDIQYNIDEERRLLFVAITRTQQELYISIPQHRHQKPTQISRFLQPLISQ